MGFFDTYGTPKSTTSTSKTKTTLELLKNSIAIQRGVINGKPVTKGKYKVKSWFANNKFTPKVGQFNLFDDKWISIGSSDHNTMLTDFENALYAGEFDSYIKDVERRKIEKKNK